MTFDQTVARLLAEKNAEIAALRAQLPPAPAADQVWRVGTKCPMNLYAHADDLAEKGEPVGVMRSPELAAHVVRAVNAWDWSSEQAATNTAIGILAGLHTAVAARRRERSLALRAAAEEIGIGFNTLARLEKGGDITLDSAIAVLRWLDKETPDA